MNLVKTLRSAIQIQTITKKIKNRKILKFTIHFSEKFNEDRSVNYWSTDFEAMSDFGNKRVHFASPGPSEAGPSKRFVAPEDHSGENQDMDQETAKTLFDNGAFLILLDVPAGTEIGIDLHSWRTGNEFRGIKMIPSGIHFVYWSSVSKEGSIGNILSRKNIQFWSKNPNCCFFNFVIKT